MRFEQSHVKNFCTIIYRLDPDETPVRLNLTRAFFMDCFKGKPIQSSEQRIGINLRPFCHQVESLKEENPEPKVPIDAKSGNTRVPSALNDSEVITSELALPEHSNSISTDSLPVARPTDSQSSMGSEYFEVIKQMRMLGLPTHFGAPPKPSKEDARKPPYEGPSSTNYQNVVDLIERHNSKLPLSFLCAISDCDMNFNAIPGSSVSTFIELCRILKFSYSLDQPLGDVPSEVYFKLPPFWNQIPRYLLEAEIDHELNAPTRKEIFYYKPPMAKSSRKCVTAQAPPAHLYEDVAGGQGDQVDNDTLEKYWAQRYRLFSLFDLGIQINREGLFSVTPEVIAVHHARRLANLLGGEPSSHTVLDLFTGAGGNCIQLARLGFNVVSVDLNEKMLEMAEHNARLYGVHKRIAFRREEALSFLRQTPARFSAVLASPPWGGPAYASATRVFPLHSSFSSSTDSQGHNTFIDLAEAIAPVLSPRASVALFLPRNTNACQFFSLHQRFLSAAGWDEAADMECELALIHGKIKGLTVYFYPRSLTSQEGEGVVVDPETQDSE